MPGWSGHKTNFSRMLEEYHAYEICSGLSFPLRQLLPLLEAACISWNEQFLSSYLPLMDLTNCQHTQLTGVLSLCFSAALTIAPQIASISVGAPRKTSCSMEE